MACCECLLIGNARPPLHLTGNAGARRMQGEGTPPCPVRDNKGLLGWRQSLKGQRDKKGRDPSTACYRFLGKYALLVYYVLSTLLPQVRTVIKADLRPLS